MRSHSIWFRYNASQFISIYQYIKNSTAIATVKGSWPRNKPPYPNFAGEISPIYCDDLGKKDNVLTPSHCATFIMGNIFQDRYFLHAGNFKVFLYLISKLELYHSILYDNACARLCIYIYISQYHVTMNHFVFYVVHSHVTGTSLKPWASARMMVIAKAQAAITLTIWIWYIVFNPQLCNFSIGNNKKCIDVVSNEYSRTGQLMVKIT